MRRSLVIYMTLHPIDFNFRIYEENFIFFFISVMGPRDDPHLGTGLAVELSHNREGLKAGLTLALKIVPPEQLQKIPII
jgi:hypothetical protein